MTKRNHTSTSMPSRQLGNSSLELSCIGLGAWAIGGGRWTFGWGPQADADSIRTIHRAIDLGINWIDTAAVYGLGHAESVVGRALKDQPHRPTIATKGGLRWRDNGSIYGCLKADSIRDEVEQSLRRLGVDTIDLYQLHWPIPDEDIEQGWGTVGELVHEGKIRFAGVSNFSIEQLRRAHAIHPVTSLQPPYSMVNRSVEQELLAFCNAHNIGVIAYSPMQCGLLTGRFGRERLARLDATDWRKKDQCFQPPIFDKTLELVDALQPIAKRRDHTVAQLAVAWVLRRSEICAAIVGARRPDQIEETAIAGTWRLDDQTLAEIDDLLRTVAIPAPKSRR